jgi:hypothetical protein
MDMLLLPGGILRASVWDPEARDTVMKDVSEELPYFLRTGVRLHDQVTLRDLLVLAETHREFLLPLFTDLLDDFVEEVQRPATTDELCELDYLEITWEAFAEGERFDLQPVLVGRNHEDEQVYSVEAVPTNAMGHLPVLLRGDFKMKFAEKGGDPEPFERPFRREFLLYDVFDAVLAEITFHGAPNERDRWWREIGSRELESGDGAEEEEV